MLEGAAEEAAERATAGERAIALLPPLHTQVAMGRDLSILQVRLLLNPFQHPQKSCCHYRFQKWM